MTISAIDMERFEAKVSPEPNTGCWLWTASADPRGYGYSRLDGRPMKAHRVSWTAYRGPIPETLLVCHRCDNPRCVNPDHLFLGTVRDNTRDMIAKGRGPTQLDTHCPNGHAYADGNTVWKAPRKWRRWRACKACIRISNHRQYLKRRALESPASGRGEQP